MKTKLVILLLCPCLLLAAGTLTIYQNAGTAGSAAFVQSKSCSAPGTSETCTFTSNVAKGNLLVVGCILGGAVDAFQLSDNKSNSYNAVGTSAVSNAGGIVNVFYAKNSNSGATTVTCTDTSATASWVQLSIHEYSGLDIGNPFDVTSSSAPLAIAPSSTTIITGYATPTAANDLMFAFAGHLNSTVLTQNGTLRENFVDNVYMASEDKIVATASIYQSSFTIANGQTSFAAIQAAFKLPKGKGTVTGL